MSDREKRRDAVKAYKERKETGGLYRIVNRETGWLSPLCVTMNLEGVRNRFIFAQRTGTQVESMLREQWRQYPPDVFAFEEVERLEKKPEQSSGEFREELEALLAMYEQGKDTQS